jgi:tRNA threonylcarbamoyladenosine biosynthesis protein TsaE
MVPQTTPHAAVEDLWAQAWQRHSRSARGTQALARRLAQALSPGSVLGLVGTLGAGKTTFVQGLAQGWGVPDLREVVSPTYTLVNIYTGGRGPLTHIDLYRLADAEAAYALGLQDSLVQPEGLVVVEWADHLPELMPPHTIWLRLTATGPAARTLEGRSTAAPPASRPR